MGKTKKRSGATNFFKKYKTSDKIYSHGVKIDKDLLDYCIQVSELLNDTSQSADERALLVGNVSTQITGHEVDLSCNQNASRLMEKLVEVSRPEQLSVLLDQVSTDLRKVCTDQYGSHVIETMMRKVSHLLKDTSSESKINVNVQLWLEKMFKYCFNNYSEFINNNYGSHVLKCSLECLSGISLQEYFKSKSLKCFEVDVTLEDDWNNLLEGFVTKISNHQPLDELIQGAPSCTVLQALVLTLGILKNKLVKSLLHTLYHGIVFSGINLDNVTTSDNLDIIFSNELKLRLLESILLVGGKKFLKEVYQGIFKLHLEKFIRHSCANYTLQILIKSTAKRSQKLFEEVFEDLCHLIPIIMSQGIFGIVVQLSQGCETLGTHQSQLYKAVLGYFECWEKSDSCVKCVLTMKKATELEEPIKVTVQGSLLTQSMLKFHKPIKLVKSLLAMPLTDLQKLAEDSSGSHVIDAYMMSTYVGAKSREQMLSKLKEIAIPLACSKHGSRSLDSMWQVATPSQKGTIIESLLQDEKALHNNFFGRKLYENYGVWSYVHCRDKWKNAVSADKKKNDFLESILNYEPKLKRVKVE